MSSSYPSFNYSGMPAPAQCMHCGAALPPNETYCGNCGYHNNMQGSTLTERAQPASPATMGWSTGVINPQNVYVQDQYAGQQWTQPAFSEQNVGNAGYEQAAATQQPFNNAFPPSAGNSFGAYQGYPGYNAPTQQATFGIPAAPPAGINSFSPGFQSSVQPQPQGANLLLSKRRSPSMGLYIGAALLVVLLVVGGIIGYSLIGAHSSQSTQSTASAQPMTLPKTPALFADTFANNNSGWNLQGETGKYSVAVGSGSLALEDDSNKLLWELIPGGKNYSNFSLAVDATLSKGSQENGYGVYIRGTANPDSDFASYYRFELYGDGTYAIFKGSVEPGGKMVSTRLVDYTASTAIQKQSKLNHILITANGSSLILNVNGQQLSKITDSSYSSGSIALFVSNLQNAPPGAQAKFSQLAIYPPIP